MRYRVSVASAGRPNPNHIIFDEAALRSIAERDSRYEFCEENKTLYAWHEGSNLPAKACRDLYAEVLS